jgi:hypothetical protein
MHVRPIRWFATLAFAVAVAAPVRSQLVLPGKKPVPSEGRSGGDVAPHYDCLVCQARNYQFHDEGRRDDNGNVVGWCTTCKRDTSQVLAVRRGSSSGQGGRLVLPTDRKPAATAPKPPTKPATGAKAPATDAPGSGQANFVYSELRQARRHDESLIAHAVERLLTLGEDGLAAARKNLQDDQAPILMTSARVLLRSGLPEDADLVTRRMLGRLPAAAGGPLLDLLVRTDPVRASPRFLAELLDHPHVGVRIEASYLKRANDQNPRWL